MSEDTFNISIESTPKKYKNSKKSSSNESNQRISNDKNTIDVQKTPETKVVEIPQLSHLLFAWENISWGVDHFKNPVQSAIAKYLPDKFVRHMIKKHKLKEIQTNQKQYGDSFEDVIDLTNPEDDLFSYKQTSQQNQSDYVSFESKSNEKMNYGRNKNSTETIYRNVFYNSITDDLPYPQTPIQNMNLLDTLKFNHDISILENISGYIRANEMTAILGASGAGKTTLLTTLSGRNNGFDGKLLLNGQIVSASVMRNLCRFIPQFDRFFEYLLVHEHLYFQAKLRLKGVDKHEIKLRVDWLMHELGLTKCSNTTIGGATHKGISGGEMRRLTLASEIIDFPSIILCDEPTSGLDSFMAQCVVRFLRTLSDKGACVLCTIHQPSYAVYTLFNNICLLDEGRIAYFGKNEETVKFFEDNYQQSCPMYCNPADFSIGLLAVDPRLSEEERNRIKEQHIANALRYEYSELHKQNELKGHLVDNTFDIIDLTKVDEESSNFIYKYIKSTFLRRCSTSWWNQFIVLMERNWKVALRDPLTVKGRFIQMVFLSVLIGIIFLRLGFEQVDIQNRLGVIFFIMMDLAFGLVFNIVQKFPEELAIFFPEYASGLYRVDTYYLAKTLVDVPFEVFFPILFCSIVYYLVGFESDFSRFIAFTGIMIMVTNATLGLGYFISCLSPSVEAASAMTAILVLPFALLGGFFLNDENIPVYLLWLSQVSMFKWGYKLLVINQFNGVTFICPPEPQPCLYPDGAAVLAQTDTTVGEIGLAIIMLFIIDIGFRIAGFFILSMRAFYSLENF